MTTPPSADLHRALLAPHALLPNGWARDVLLVWDAAGHLATVTSGVTGVTGVPTARGLVLPGMPNLHSHAFQRAFAGLTEYRGAADDSFWSWRERMYRFAAALTPEQIEDIATHLYIEMLRAGYTSVCEFHYVHHDADGRPYDDSAEMALRIVSAARKAGIGLTLLPVLYQASGFGGQPPSRAQRRFINDADAMLRMIERLRTSDAKIGVAPHSLRAVPPEALRDVVGGLHAMDPAAPVHIHIAEQQKEVDDCIAWSGARPVRWLLDNAPVDQRWCLVHATHVDADEVRDLARSRAVAGLCPTTEANLGDGIFPAAEYLNAGGAWGIGSDSHATIDVAEELRLLEYGQRLAQRRRNVLASEAEPELAQRLWLGAVQGGAAASARPVDGLRSGQRADFIVLHDADTNTGLTPPQTLASHLFARHPDTAKLSVWAGGACRVDEGRHALADAARRRFIDARRRLIEEA